MSPWHLRQAAWTLRAGGLIAYPTETIYGLGCDPLNHLSVTSLLALKKRSINKGLILIGASLEQLTPFIDTNNKQSLERLESKIKKPTTWLMPAREDTPNWLTGNHDTIAVRITQHPVAAKLCEQFGGAIVSTSANPAGKKPARDLLKIHHYFNNDLDYILCGDTKTTDKPSEIRDARTNKTIRT